MLIPLRPLISVSALGPICLVARLIRLGARIRLSSGRMVSRLTRGK